MCYAILRISYKNNAEPTIYKEVATLEELTKITSEIIRRDGVKKVTSFFPYATLELISEWRVFQHEESDKNPLPSTEPFPTAEEVSAFSRYKQEHLG